jgi:uracil-DNA glycosylase family 4
MEQTFPHDALRALDDLKAIIERERQLFGETLLYERAEKRQAEVEPQPQMQSAAASLSRPTKHPAVEEPLLFELPQQPAAPITTEAWGQATTLDELNALICKCTKCPLGFTRTNFVFGVGNPHATLMLIGEAPGADEDAQGEPFVGRAGQLLTRILEAINFKRSDVYICNILKCRPPNNRKPTPEESETCKPYLKKQIALVKPKVILCLGLTAAENLLGTNESMSRLRGRVMQYEGIPVMVTYHPAALLRNPNWKRPTWEDVQAVRKLHDDLVKQ